MDDEEMMRLEEQVPQVALDALNAAQREAVASGMPLVMVIGDGLYRVSGTGEKELIRMLPPRKQGRGRAKRATS